MNIIKRFADIMAANFNGLIEKFEDPEKMIDQYLRNLEKDLGEVKSETADVMVIQSKAEAKLKTLQGELKKWLDLANKALSENNEDDAKKFTGEVLKVEDEIAIQTDTITRAKQNTDKMLEIHDKLLKDMEQLRSQRDELMARNSIAKASATVTKAACGYGSSADHNIAGYNRMRDKIEDSIKKSEALESLSERPASDANELAKKYTLSADEEQVKRVQERLEKIKAAS